MRRMLITLCLVLAPVMLFSCSASAQSSGPQVTEQVTTCSGPLYKAGDVSRQVRIITSPQPAGTSGGEDGKRARGKVVLRVVLCHTGEVTDIKVIKKLPDGLTERAVEAAKSIKFEPAEKDGRKVSQRARLEYTFYVQ
jgi:TonB family protein